VSPAAIFARRVLLIVLIVFIGRFLA